MSRRRHNSEGYLVKERERERERERDCKQEKRRKTMERVRKIAR